MFLDKVSSLNVSLVSILVKMIFFDLRWRTRQCVQRLYLQRLYVCAEAECVEAVCTCRGCVYVQRLYVCTEAVCMCRGCIAETTGDTGDLGSTPELRRSPGRRK